MATFLALDMLAIMPGMIADSVLTKPAIQHTTLVRKPLWHTAVIKAGLATGGDAGDVCMIYGSLI